MPNNSYSQMQCSLCRKVVNTHSRYDFPVYDPRTGFGLCKQCIKDLNNALECAHTVGAPVPMTAQVLEVMQYLNNNGDGKSDHSAIAHYYEKLADIKIGREE